MIVKHLKNVRSSQTCISINVLKKTQVLPCENVNKQIQRFIYIESESESFI